LVFEATFRQNSTDWEVSGPTQVDVVLEASPTNFHAFEIPVVGSFPACWGQGDLPAVGTFELLLDVSAGPTDAPPSVTITIPSSVTCDGTPVSLSSTTSDPDGDLDRVEWFVDDVLIDPSLSAMGFTAAHVVRAVAFDARGAATTATKSISCL
jgi:hypothetical protein